MLLGMGAEYRIIEECLNGRTTGFDDPCRPSRNGIEHIQFVIESHSPVDIVILFLGINDFQDVIGISKEESAAGLCRLVEKIQMLKPEPMKDSAKILAILPPEITSPQGIMAKKFSHYKKATGSVIMYKEVLAAKGIDFLLASDVVNLSTIDGIHLDAPQHLALGGTLAALLKDFIED